MNVFGSPAYIALPRLLLVAAFLLAPFGVAQAQAAARRPNVAYGPLPAEQGDLYLPGGGRRPAVVMIHGGGWVEGSRHAYDELAAAMAAMGVVVFNIDYRLADKAQPGTRWPAQLVDAQLAVRFLRAHAAEFGVDGRHIGAIGDSAGAQLAVFLGVLPRIVPGDEAGLLARERPDVQAVVDQYGPMDLPGMGFYGAASIEALFGTKAPPGAALLSASPLPAVTAHSAPVYIVHGETDEVVPFDQSRRLQDALRAHGVFEKLVTFQGGHAYGGVAAEKVGTLQWDAVKWLVGRLG